MTRRRSSRRSCETHEGAAPCRSARRWRRGAGWPPRRIRLSLRGEHRPASRCGARWRSCRRAPGGRRRRALPLHVLGTGAGENPVGHPRAGAHRLSFVAACSPHLHEATFRSASAEAGLNPFLCEMANIREHCAWVHQDGALATEKACETVAGMVEKAPPRPSAARDRGGGHQAGTRDRRGSGGFPGGTRHRERRLPGHSWSSAARRSAGTWPASPRPSPRWTARSASSRRSWWKPCGIPTSSC